MSFAIFTRELNEIFTRELEIFTMSFAILQGS